MWKKTALLVWIQWSATCFKGTVQPKMLSSSFTHPHVILNLHDFLLWCINWGIVKNVSVFFVQWKATVINTVLITSIHQNILFCVLQNKESHTGDGIRQWWQTCQYITFVAGWTKTNTVCVASGQIKYTYNIRKVENKVSNGR